MASLPNELMQINANFGLHSVRHLSYDRCASMAACNVYTMPAPALRVAVASLACRHSYALNLRNSTSYAVRMLLITQCIEVRE